MTMSVLLSRSATTPPHPEEARSAVSKGGDNLGVATLRDASLRDAPQGEVGREPRHFSAGRGEVSPWNSGQEASDADAICILPVRIGLEFGGTPETCRCSSRGGGWPEILDAQASNADAIGIYPVQ